jgi:undecaprenyl-diphosphatase
VLIVSLPRVYFGIHFPSDILAGALLGIGLGSAFAVDKWRKSVGRPSLRWLEHSPATFLPCLFLATFVVATNFDPLRTVVVFSINATKAYAHTPAPATKAVTPTTSIASK